MKKEQRRSQARLSAPAKDDIRDILRWSERYFGGEAGSRYQRLLRQAMRDIAKDPERPGSRVLENVGGMAARVYPILLSRLKIKSSQRVKSPRHFLIYRVLDDGTVEVSRVLHDARDLVRHLPEE